ncbi:hypothetical protein SH668x_001821 [Planctomicrobium sp. SH668]|uniref:hypothetical protein n=1 Tax=Planctomicrobium sp. SH668 TaxID=3448126 RepID=UPI003F5C9F9E
MSGPAGKTVQPAIRSVDPDGQGTLQPLGEAVMDASGPTRVRGLFRHGKLKGSLQIQILDGEQLLKAFPVRIGAGGAVQVVSPSTSVWVAVGNQPVISGGIAEWNSSKAGSVQLIELPDLEQSILSGEALDGVDVIALTGDVKMSETASRSIRDWVRRGGRLILSIGNTTESLSQSSLMEWLPIEVNGQSEIVKLAGIQELVPRSSQLRTLTKFTAANLKRGNGIVVASGISGPLVTRSAYGQGEVTAVAVRLDEPPLSTWESSSQAKLSGILGYVPDSIESLGTGARAQVDLDPNSVTDLQSQLNHTLDSFSQVKKTSPWMVIGWIALFAVVIGPLDYLVVSYWLKRPELTWITMLMWTALASLFAISMGDRVNSHPPVARQMSSLNFDVATNTVRGESWYNFYSDSNRRHRVTTKFGTAFGTSTPETVRVSWVNRPGDGFRGMLGSGGLDESKPQYRFFQDASGIENFPVRNWSSGSVKCEWEYDHDVSNFIQSSLTEGRANRIGGTLTHHLPGELTDWFLACGSVAYFERGQGGGAQPLRPGEEWNVSRASSNLLRGRIMTLIQEKFTGKISTAADEDLQRLRYDRNNVDPYVNELATSFYEVIGGESFTGLKNDSLSQLDLSSTIELKRAVLFGRMKLPPMEFELDGEPLPIEEQSVLVKILIPVQVVEREADLPPPADVLVPRK